MARHRGVDVDTAARRVRDRDGCWYPAENLVVSEAGLYYYRDFPDGELFSRNEKWLLPGPGWVINRLSFLPHVPDPLDWYIEPDSVQVDGSIWRVRDAFLDLEVYEGVRYELLDADELADGLAAGEITLAEALVALQALDKLCGALRRHGFSGRALLVEFASGLPR
jgi:predicted RNA-binding protein associated with RNAse of E/G family